MSGRQLQRLVAEGLAAANVAPDTAPATRGRPRLTEWDKIVPGFGVRHYASGRQVFIVQVEADGRTSTVTIGSSAVITRKLARDIARRVKLRAQTGEDPARARKEKRKSPLFADFVSRYYTLIGPTWKPRTRSSQDGYRRRNIDGHFAGRYVDEITQADIQKWFVHVSDHSGPGAANRVHAIMRHMFNKAEEWGMRPEGSNPCVGIKMNRGRKFERYLSQEEFGRLGKVLCRHETAEPVAVAIIRMLLLTGCRYGEIADLTWREVKRNKLELNDSKTGARTVWLGAEAVGLLQDIGRGKPDELVFPNPRTGKPYSDINVVWHPIRKEAGLGRVRLHDLRHSFASHAAAASETLPMIGKLLGHARVDTTARYAHLDDKQLVEIVQRIGDLIESAMERGRAS